MKAPHLHPIPTYDDTEIRCISLASKTTLNRTLLPFSKQKERFYARKKNIIGTKRISFSKKKERKATINTIIQDAINTQKKRENVFYRNVLSLYLPNFKDFPIKEG